MAGILARFSAAANEVPAAFTGGVQRVKTIFGVDRPAETFEPIYDKATTDLVPLNESTTRAVPKAGVPQVGGAFGMGAPVMYMAPTPVQFDAKGGVLGRTATAIKQGVQRDWALQPGAPAAVADPNSIYGRETGFDRFIKKAVAFIGNGNTVSGSKAPTYVKDPYSVGGTPATTPAVAPVAAAATPPAAKDDELDRTPKDWTKAGQDALKAVGGVKQTPADTGGDVRAMIDKVVRPIKDGDPGTWNGPRSNVASMQNATKLREQDLGILSHAMPKGATALDPSVVDHNNSSTALNYNTIKNSETAEQKHEAKMAEIEQRGEDQALTRAAASPDPSGVMEAYRAHKDGKVQYAVESNKPQWLRFGAKDTARAAFKTYVKPEQQAAADAFMKEFPQATRVQLDEHLRLAK